MTTQSETHTPKPWEVKELGKSLYVECHVSPAEQSLCCEIQCFDEDAGPQPIDHANARLIACAPDGYEVCKAIAALADGQGQLNLVIVAAQARAYLAKVEGR